MRYHGDAVVGRGRNTRNIARACQRHVQLPGDRRCRHRQYVDFRPQLFQVFLLRDAEALFLVDHDETKIFEANVGGNEPVRPDNNVDFSIGQIGKDPSLFRGGPKSGKHFDRDREWGESLRKGFVMLLRQDGRWDQDPSMTRA